MDNSRLHPEPLSAQHLDEEWFESFVADLHLAKEALVVAQPLRENPLRYS
jgi:hypothetical protein